MPPSTRCPQPNADGPEWKRPPPWRRVEEQPMRTPFSADQLWQEMAEVASAAALPGQPAPLFAASHRALGNLIGAKLFTILKVLADGSTERMYTSDPAAYPLSGRKPRNSTPWFEKVIVAQQHYFGPTKAHIREVFFDHELIFSLGCGS